VPESQIVETLIEEAMRIASERGSDDSSGSPVVTVS
jgi:(E)-4-hydroxy-3-methylbut-2-enyl-diphosphate synthase